MKRAIHIWRMNGLRISAQMNVRTANHAQMESIISVQSAIKSLFEDREKNDDVNDIIIFFLFFHETKNILYNQEEVVKKTNQQIERIEK